MFKNMSEFIEFPDPFDTPEPVPVETEVAEPESPAPNTDGKAVAAAQRKAVTLTVKVAQADPATRKAAAALVGVRNPEDVAALTLAILSAGKQALRPLRDIAAVAEVTDPFEKADKAISLADSEARFKAAWDVLGATLGSDLGRIASPAKAGMAFAKAVSSLTKEQLRELDRPRELFV